MKIKEKALKNAISQFEKMTVKDKENVVDEIYAQQPNMLASILVQSQLGSSIEHIEVLLKILTVLHIALKDSKVQILLVTEDEQERELNRLAANIRFSEGLPNSILSKSIKSYVDKHSEKYAFAFAYDELASTGIMFSKTESSKFLVLSGLNLVNCIACAKAV